MEASPTVPPVGPGVITPKQRDHLRAQRFRNRLKQLAVGDAVIFFLDQCPAELVIRQIVWQLKIKTRKVRVPSANRLILVRVA